MLSSTFLSDWLRFGLSPPSSRRVGVDLSRKDATPSLQSTAEEMTVGLSYASLSINVRKPGLTIFHQL